MYSSTPAQSVKNWLIGDSPSVLTGIHETEVNIALYEREMHHLQSEVEELCNAHVEIRATGKIRELKTAISSSSELVKFKSLREDIHKLLDLFEQSTHAENFRLFLATVGNNMCGKFHTDINDLRLLCTYKGAGTQWLSEDNINRKHEDCCDDDACLVVDESQIRQAKEGSVVLLKGALYPKKGTIPILHRSPMIEGSGQKRLLLRIDTDEFANF